MDVLKAAIGGGYSVPVYGWKVRNNGLETRVER